MKKIIYFLIAGLFFSSCTHSIIRTGYEIKKSDYKECDVVIKKDTSFSDTLVKKVGEIKLGETGFAVACSEAHAINILKGEACALDADLIIVTNENRPDLWSSCYRCSAEIYQYKSRNITEQIENDDIYNSENLNKRVNQDRGRNTAIAIVSITI